MRRSCQELPREACGARSRTASSDRSGSAASPPPRARPARVRDPLRRALRLEAAVVRWEPTQWRACMEPEPSRGGRIERLGEILERMFGPLEERKMRSTAGEAVRRHAPPLCPSPSRGRREAATCANDAAIQGLAKELVQTFD